MSKAVVWLSTALLLLACAPAHADPSDVEIRARQHYTAGKTLYRLGNYSDALRELLLGYDLVEKPLFLLNIGQCYRKLDDLPKARAMYQKYLDTTPPDDRERAQVEEVLKDLDRQIAERAPPPPPPPEPVASPEPVVVPATLVTPEPLIVKHKRRAWWAIPVALVGAAGLGVGLYFALKPSCTASYGCLSASGGQ